MLVLKHNKLQRSVFNSLVIGLLVFSCGLIVPSGTQALVKFDFDQKYLVHPGVQTWDFCIIRPDSLYHVYYTAVTEGAPSPANADSLLHATSPDLKHWTLEGAALKVSEGQWDNQALWAPDVFRDEENNQWVMAYTGVDQRMNQRIGIAFSDDLYTWTKADFNPAIEPDSTQYIWGESRTWSDFRDPFIYRQDDQWHVLVTAKKRMPVPTGVLYHAVTTDLENWTDVGPLFVNDGANPDRVLESPQYFKRHDVYHLLFGEYSNIGANHLISDQPDTFSMDSNRTLGYGYAPEIDQFDPDIDIFGRLANHQLNGVLAYTLRFDTLQVSLDGSEFEIMRPNPLDEQWEVRLGTSNLGNPTFGDNPIYRAEPSVGLQGNSYYGSGEYYQGPLSSRGYPGGTIGDSATGTLKSYPFFITGTGMDLLVGGGNNPETCYIALVDAATDTVLYSETGNGNDLMTPRSWNLLPYKDRLVYLTIVDQETRASGHINVDEIIEIYDEYAAVDDILPSAFITDLGAAPNPFNPQTNIRFNLTQQLELIVKIHDLRGQLIWNSGIFSGKIGINSVPWAGRNQAGSAVATGIYLYSVETSAGIAASGKLTLVK